MTRGRALVTLLLVVATAGCSLPHENDGDRDRAAAEAAPTEVPTLTGLPEKPPPPPSGTLVTDMRQSSIDASLGQMQVWVDVDRRTDLTPTRIVYRDARFRTPLRATNLRLDPSRSERGFPITLPGRPRCDADVDPLTLEGSGRLEVTERGGRTTRVPVADETDVVGRYVTTRCQEIAIARVVDLSWADTVPVQDGDGGSDVEGSTGTLTLVARPTGAPGKVVVDQVTGSYLLTADTPSGFWAPDRVVRGDGPVVRVPLPLVPARCDGHAFGDGGGATAFTIKLHLDGEPLEILLRMDDAGSAAALTFAQRSCGIA